MMRAMKPGSARRSGGALAYLARDGVVEAVRVKRAEPGSREVRIEVEWASLGSFGWPSRTGVEWLGDTFVGRIIDVGAQVDRARLGEDVLGIKRAGAAASELTMPAAIVYSCDRELPGSLVTAVATSGMVAASLLGTEVLGPDTVVVVNEAGNGISLILAGLVRQAGGTAIAVRSFETDADLLRTAGFEFVVLPTDDSPADAIRRYTGGRGGDLVIECARPVAPWAHIDGLLADGGVALTWAPGTDWDPTRSRVVGVIAELSRRFMAGGELVIELSNQVHELSTEVLAGRLHLPVVEIDHDDAQTAYDLCCRPDFVGRVALRLGDR